MEVWWGKKDGVYHWVRDICDKCLTIILFCTHKTNFKKKESGKRKDYVCGGWHHFISILSFEASILLWFSKIK